MRQYSYACLVVLLSISMLDAVEAQETSEASGKAVLTITLPGGIEMKFCRIPAGDFTMGSPSNEKDRDKDEGPQHKVVLSRPFYLGMVEVTQAQWEAVMDPTASRFSPNPDHPVEGVSWEDCQAFVKRMNDLGVGTFRLPTEAEWEYACRATTTTRFYWGDDPDCSEIENYAWHKGNSDKRSHKVGQKKPNLWGLYDMSGNVWEWCQDWYGDYSGDPQTDPNGPKSGSSHVFRGNGWRWDAKFCRSANRYYSPPGHAIGLRLLRETP